MAFEIQALSELKPNNKWVARQEEDGTFSFEWDVNENNGEAAPTIEVINAKAAEIAAEMPLRLLRRTRNEILASTDWRANSDVEMSDDWKTYRQALRDITKTVTDDNIRKAMSNSTNHTSWPTKPN
tara:strand:+ start:1107 stop:1484 length:378 start_codon:yes stop_codon:yes gene_type:complete